MNGVLQEFLDPYHVLQTSYGVLSSDLAHELCKLVVASVAARLNVREAQGCLTKPAKRNSLRD